MSETACAAVVDELTPAPDPEAAFARMAARPHVVFFDSAWPDATLARYSFLAADPFAWFEAPATEYMPRPARASHPGDALAELARRATEFRAATIKGLPPFQGGIAGLWSYDLGQQLERVPAAEWDEFQAPALAVGWYDVVVAWDHREGRAWIISQGFPEHDPARRSERATRRAAQVREWLSGPRNSQPRSGAARPIAATCLAPSHAVPGPAGLLSNFDAEGYLRAVRRAIDYVLAGDVFQVNLAQRLLYPAADDSVELYLRLRQRNPATFAAYFDLGEFQIASASPERFLRVVEGQVEARPIKGTRRRSHQPEADLFAGDDLQGSEKDRAENVMIVDLMRNDLSRVCQAESVAVTQLCRLESYEYVQHLVSAIQGTLAPGVGPLDLLRAAFPGGSVTGAPKIRAMEIIAELEQVARGPYCGSLGYLGFDGTLDTNILIRTITCGRGWWQLPVGGGIVAASEPRREYEETWHKAEGLLRALG